MKPRAVIDTNVWISALKKGPVEKVLSLWLEDTFEVAISENILKEISDVLRRPKFNFSPEECGILINLINEKAIFCSPMKKITLCKDHYDNKFIECAIESNSSYIISGDKHLLEVGEYKNIKIITPAKFIAFF